MIRTDSEMPPPAKCATVFAKQQPTGGDRAQEDMRLGCSVP